MIQALIDTVDINSREELEVLLEDLENSIAFLSEREKEIILEKAKCERALEAIKKEKAEKTRRYKLLLAHYYRKEKEA